ncbi:MAG TPA: hypothetical protein VHX44_16400, partial [Planctomycetota bacterium]|nr:hypothetical protein [Planctomycetota bacterium]
MHRFFVTIISCTLAALAGAADAPVLVQLTIPDGARLAQHVRAGVFGRLWNDVALAPLRAKLDQVLPQAEQELGFSPLALPESLSALQATLFELPLDASAENSAAYNKSPDFSVHIGLGKLAAQIFAKLKEQIHEPGAAAIMVGATEAFTISGSQATLVRIGETLLLGSRPQRLIPNPISPSDHDLTFRFNDQYIAETARIGMPPEKFKKTKNILNTLHRFL